MTSARGRIVPVIMSGGAGTRLWPLARDHRPKPLLPLAGGTSTFALTLDRIADRRLFAEPVVVANRAHRHAITAALDEAGHKARLLLEPTPRDTTAAIAAAAKWVAGERPQALLLVLAADHLIRDVDGFRRTVEAAAGAAEEGMIVTFGIVPTGPATGYGYIERGAAVPGAPAVRRVARFIEKPDAATARRLIDAGCLWNSGNFMMPVEVALAELGAHAPDVLAAAATAIDEAAIAPDGTVVLGEAFRAARRISFDHAVMERTGRAAVIEASFDWSDLGTWNSVWEAAAKDERGNAVAGDALLVASSRNYVSSDRGTVGVVGLDDLVVVASDDCVLVAPRERSDSVKALAEALARREEAVFGDRARHYRPWGYYQALDFGPAHQVKRLVVNPGARLSLQSHRHRAEHWTVVEGVAEVTIGERTWSVHPNETAYIPVGAVHRIANPAETPATIIEVQCGDYLGEDDIIRYEDDYGRVAAAAAVGEAGG
jgi:mannose-1-phosphate guanylyltransferase/mannose-6-phosphate isomerase